MWASSFFSTGAALNARNMMTTRRIIEKIIVSPLHSFSCKRGFQRLELIQQMLACGCIEACILAHLGLFAERGTHDKSRDKHDPACRDDFEVESIHLKDLIIKIGHGDAQPAVEAAFFR